MRARSAAAMIRRTMPEAWSAAYDWFHVIGLMPPHRLPFRGAALVASLAAIACLLTCPLAAVAADDACKELDSWLEKTGTDSAAYKQAKAEADANKIPAPEAIRFAVNELAKRPTPFHAELSSQTWPGRGTAWVMFEGNRIANIKDADAGKLCVRAFAGATSRQPRELTIKQAFLDTATKGDNVKRVKVVVEVGPAPGDLYSNVDFLFVGALADATPATFFNYSKEVTVANNRTATALTWLFVIAAYLLLARVTYKRDAEDQGKLERFTYVLSPIRISAAWYGDASLSQLQVLLFTFIVAGMLFYFWLSSGVLSDISKDLLILLGISAVGAGGSKFTQTLKSELPGDTARYLIGKGWYDWPLLPLRQCATFRNLLLTDGRLDVYKFQMAIFTVVVACYVVSSGQTSLGDVKISDTMLYLMGISQGVYVGGKAVTERTKDLEDAAKKMMEIDKLPASQKSARVGEYTEAEKTAAIEFASLYNRQIPKHP